MSLILSSLRCPWCAQAVSKSQLKEQGSLKAYLARKPFTCPHCQQAITLPEKAETLISSGLFVAVILAPLFYYYQWLFIDPPVLFALGVALVVVGIWLQKLIKVITPETDANGRCDE